MKKQVKESIQIDLNQEQAPMGVQEVANQAVESLAVGDCACVTSNLFRGSKADMLNYGSVASSVVCDNPSLAGKDVTLQFEYEFEPTGAQEIRAKDWVRVGPESADQFTFFTDLSQAPKMYFELEIQSSTSGRATFYPITGGQPRITSMMPYLDYGPGETVVGGVFRTFAPWEGFTLYTLEGSNSFSVRRLRYAVVENKEVKLLPKVNGSFQNVADCPVITIGNLKGKAVHKFKMKPEWTGLRFDSSISGAPTAKLRKPQLELGSVATKWSVPYDELFDTAQASKQNTMEAFVAGGEQVSNMDEFLGADTPFQIKPSSVPGESSLHLRDTLAKRLATQDAFATSFATNATFTDKLATNAKFTDKLATNPDFIQRIDVKSGSLDTRTTGKKQGVVVNKGEGVITSYNPEGIDAVVIDCGKDNNPTLKLKASQGNFLAHYNPTSAWFTSNNHDIRVGVDGLVGVKNGVNFGYTPYRLFFSGVSLDQSALSLSETSTSNGIQTVSKASLDQNALSLSKTSTSNGIQTASTVSLDQSALSLSKTSTNNGIQTVVSTASLSDSALQITGVSLSKDCLQIKGASLSKDTLSMDGASFGRSGITVPKGASIDMPGVLAAYTVNSIGICGYSYGAKKSTDVITFDGTGRYTIPHKIGHTKYIATVSAVGDSAHNAVVISQNDKDVVVTIFHTTNKKVSPGAFNLVLVGDN